MTRAPFITLEGGEGCGKSTHAGLLAQRLQEQGLPVLLTHEPGATELGRALRRLLADPAGPDPCPQAELLLYLADRAQHLEQVIRPALASGRVVVCDRFADSSEVYQGLARGLSRQRVRELNRWLCGDTWPDLTLVLDLDPALGLARARQRQGEAGLDRLELAGGEFHRRVREGFLELARREPDRVRLVDAAGSRQEVARRIWELVQPLLESWRRHREA